MTASCPNCGAAVPLSGSEPLTTCAHCSSSLWVDLGAVLLHTAMAPALDEAQARRLVRRGGGSPGAARLVWRPYWLFTRAASARMAPADTHLRTELDECPALAGHERAFAGSSGPAGHAVPPNIPLAAVLGEEERASARARLVHVPFWEIPSGTGTASVDAVEGRLALSTGDAVAPRDTRVRGAAVVIAAGFFLAALLPGLGPPALACAMLIAAGYLYLVNNLQ